MALDHVHSPPVRTENIATASDAQQRRPFPQRARNRARNRLMKRVLTASDIFSVAGAFVCSELLYKSAAGPNGRVELALIASLPGWIVLAKLLGLYDRGEIRAEHSTIDELPSIIEMTAIGVLLFTGAVVATGITSLYTPGILLFFIFAAASIAVMRGLMRLLVHRRAAPIENAVIIGAGLIGQLVALKLIEHNDRGINLVGFVDSAPRELASELDRVAVLGGPERLPEIIRFFDVDRAIIAFSRETPSETLDIIRSMRNLNVQIDIVPRLFEMVGPRVDTYTLNGLPMLGLAPGVIPRSSLYLKRAIDIVLGSVLLILLAPLFAYIALRIKLDSNGPVLYRHVRVGRGGKGFCLYKFRTMTVDRDGTLDFQRLMLDPVLRTEFESTYKLRNDPRVTRFGAFLRRTSLDELPQLVNVIRGEMSLIGPRPVVRAELERYGRDAEALTTLPPGITGYWQISGRSDVSYPERVRLDMSYVRDWSLPLDLTILAKTARVILSRRGAY